MLIIKSYALVTVYTCCLFVLLLEVLVDDGHVLALVLVSLLDMLVNLVRLVSKKHGRARLLGNINGKAKILSHQVDTEATDVISRRRSGRVHTRDRVVDLRGPRSTGGGVDNVREELEVTSQLLSEVEGLSSGDVGHSQEVVVSELGSQTLALATAVDNSATHELEEVLDLLEDLLLVLAAADHECEGALLSTNNTTRHGGIHKRSRGVLLGHHVATLDGCLGVNCGAVNENLGRLFGESIDQLGVDSSNMHGLREHGENDIGLVGDLHSGGEHLQLGTRGVSGLGDLVKGSLVHVKHIDGGVAINGGQFLLEIESHGETHSSETNETVREVSVGTEGPHGLGGGSEGRGEHVVTVGCGDKGDFNLLLPGKAVA